MDGGFGLVQEALPMLTNPPIWASLHSITLLPIITGRDDQTKHTKESGQYTD